MPEQRLFTPNAIEVRTTGDGRTVEGICCPFNQPADISEFGRRFTEVFRPGSFARTIDQRAGRVRLYAKHQTSQFPIGAATMLRESSDGLIGEFRISQTSAGEDALALAKDGVFDSFSVGFYAGHDGGDRWSSDRTFREVVDATLHEVSLVENPAYVGAAVTGMRSRDDLVRELRAFVELRAGKMISAANAAVLLEATNILESAAEQIEDVTEAIEAVLEDAGVMTEQQDEPEKPEETAPTMGRSLNLALAQAFSIR